MTRDNGNPAPSSPKDGGSQIESANGASPDIRDRRAFLAALAGAGAASLVGWLKTLLMGHNYDEEHGVYVEADRLLGADERRRLIERFQGRSDAGM